MSDGSFEMFPSEDPDYNCMPAGLLNSLRAGRMVVVPTRPLWVTRVLAAIGIRFPFE